jgi:hypothetical protein
LSLFCFANGETLIEAIESNKYKRYKKVTKKGDTKILAPPFLWAWHRQDGEDGVGLNHRLSSGRQEGTIDLTL